REIDGLHDIEVTDRRRVVPSQRIVPSCSQWFYPGRIIDMGPEDLEKGTAGSGVNHGGTLYQLIR
ncbi:MAG: hypothetical protein KAI96_03615, partial [Thermodesulfovibrionia bacterium]|nr:hypothetical protein [Thermodesulfovibrionia bacterium]